jgi:hypothetical protein
MTSAVILASWRRLRFGSGPLLGYRTISCPLVCLLDSRWRGLAGLARPGFRYERYAGVGHDLPAPLACRECAADHLAVWR